MRFRLHQRYFLTILCLVTIGMAAVSAALLLHYERSITEMKEATARAFADGLAQQFEHRAHGLGLITAEALVNPLALMNIEGVQNVIRAVEAEPDVVSVFVSAHDSLSAFNEYRHSRIRQLRSMDKQRLTAALSDRSLVRQTGANLVVSAPVRMGDQLLGAVSVELSTAALERDIDALAAKLVEIDRLAKRSRTVWLVGIAGILGILSMLSTIFLARNLSRPIELLSAATARIGRGEYRIEIPLRRTDEIGDLARSLEAMARNLQRTTVSRDNFDRILSSMRDALLVTTPDGVITNANQGAARLLSCATAELIGRPISEVVTGGEAIITFQHHDLLKTGFLESFETTVVGRDRRSIPVLLSAAPMRERDDTVKGIVCVLHDIAERKQVETEVQHMAHHDALTGLPNRVLLQDRLNQAIAQARRGGHTVALLLVDLDQFKDVNDTLGHTVGDKVLTAIAGRISGTLREMDTVARLGGDEFAIVQTGTHQPQDAEALCRRLVETISTALHLGGREIYIGASIGIALCPADGEDLERLLRNADMALYQAKAEGRSTWRFFEGRMELLLQERKALEGDLRRGFGRGELTLHYQPQLDLAKRDFIGVEALLRWRHPEHGWMPPEVFVPLAEQTGLIMPLGEWVLQTACQQAAAWRAQGGKELRVSVNLSPAQFRHPDLAGLVQAVLAAAHLPPRLLELEITEGILMHETSANLATLHRLRQLGVRIAMDDFGTGYSSLGYLRRFAFDAIKIDRSFVRDLGRSAEAAAVLHAAITLGRSLGIDCIAEGVETEAQLALLEEAGCLAAQGYYFSAAVPAAKINRMLKQRCQV